MCSLCRLPVAKNHNFGQILTFWGLLYRRPLTDEGQIWSSIADPWYTLTCQILSRSVYSVALCWRKSPIFAVFLTSAFSVVANWQQSDKVEHRCTTTNFPLSNGIKSFLCPNASIAKCDAQSLTFKSVTNKQTDRQTNRQKTQRFWPPRRRVKSEPTKHGMVIEDFEHVLAPLKLLGLIHSFAATGTENLGEPDPFNLKPP